MAKATPDGQSHIVTYRCVVGVTGCTLHGRVLQRPPAGGPRSEDDWWDNLLNTYRRFDSERMPGVPVTVSFRGHEATVPTDDDGYYEVHFPVTSAAGAEPWETAEVRCADGGPAYRQQVLCVPDSAAFGVISDIDDTVLESNVTQWQTAAQLTFLHNARTRKPLEGVAKLYQAFHRGSALGRGNPIFYVSASPWNLYDLLEDFMEINEIPPGPILLRDLDFDRESFRMETAARNKVAHVHRLIEHFPKLKWVLVGDSGQIDAELYARTLAKYPGRILAVYIRDIDPASDSPYDLFVDRHIEQVAHARVPMLRVADSNAIAAHARGLGLIEADEIGEVADEVQRDHVRPGMKEAARP